MPTALDIGYVVFLFVLITVVEGLVFFPRFKAAVAAGVPDARAKAYRRATLGQWAFTAIVIVGWIVAKRSWTALGVVPPTDWRLYAGIALIAAIGFFGFRQAQAIGRLSAKAEGVDEYRTRLAELSFLLPHTRGEYRGFMLLSITAGICEELLCRGYLIWVLRAYTSLAGAIVISAIAFGLGHAYQGTKGIVKTTVVGVAMNLIVLLTGWLLPAMVVHAILDVSAGQLGYAVLRERPSPD